MLRITELLAILILTVFLSSHVAQAQKHLANPVPPNITPQWNQVPGVAGVRYAPNLTTDLFRYGGHYYYYHRGKWYQGRRTRGPWTPIRRLPSPLYRIHAPYFKTPPGWAQGKKTGWRGAPMPPGQMKKYPHPQPPGVLPPGSQPPGIGPHRQLDKSKGHGSSGQTKKFPKTRPPGKTKKHPKRPQ